ncbi:MAG: hypothetical protein IT238_01825 [Bacteroidia bacterium]|nr:hypothetical protein [Bacteroidia bacterium]MCZ2247714.1 hypothetical protein [Bacteroidia bacterium]
MLLIGGVSRLKEFTTTHNNNLGITSNTTFDTRGRIQARANADTVYTYNGSNRLITIENPTSNLLTNN